MKSDLSSAFRSLFRKSARPSAPVCRTDAIKGVSSRVIIVPAPISPVFREAIFVLSEDYVNHSGVDEKSILAQAKKAAESYTAALIPPAEHKKVNPLWPIIALAASAALALNLSGLI